MKCSRRNAPIGTMPVSECRRRRRKENPSPARSGATPGLIFGATADVGATIEAPCGVKYDGWNRILSGCVGTQVKEAWITHQCDDRHNLKVAAPKKLSAPSS